MGKFDIKVTGIYHDICLSFEKIAARNSTHGMNSVTARPVVPVLQVTIVPVYQSVACNTTSFEISEKPFIPEQMQTLSLDVCVT